MSGGAAFPLIVGGVGITCLLVLAPRMNRLSRAARSAGRPRPRSVVVFRIALWIAILGYAVMVSAALFT